MTYSGNWSWKPPKLPSRVSLGLVTVTRFQAAGWPRFFNYELHRRISLLSVVFLGTHIGAAVLDPYTHLGVAAALAAGALAVAGLLGTSFTLVILVLGLLLWDRFAVVARSTTMQIRNLDYVAAARCAG